MRGSLASPAKLKPGEKITEPGCYDLSISRYHSQCCDGPSISSSGLRTIFTESPAHYWSGSSLNPNRIERKESEALIVGQAAHHLLLGQASFDKHFVVRPEKWDSWRTKESKVWRDEQLLDGRTCLEPKHLEIIAGMRDGLRAHPLIAAGVLDGYVERSLVWRDEETGVWLLSRPDAIPSDSGDTADLKTATDVSRDALERTLADYRYDIQGAIVRRGLKAVLGLDMTSFALVFAEKAPPFCAEVVEVSPIDLDLADADLSVALRLFARCLKTDHWPGPGGTQADAVPVSLPEWARRKAEARRLFLEQELAA